MKSSPTCFLAVDVGNTATNFGLFKIEPRTATPHPFKTWVIGSHEFSSRQAKKIISTRLRPYQHRCAGAVVSSVVPSVDPKIRRLLRSLLKVSPIFIDSRSISPVTVLYRHPEEVGADR